MSSLEATVAWHFRNFDIKTADRQGFFENKQTQKFIIMDVLKISEINYDNHIRCCRVCMEIFQIGQKFIIITENIEKLLEGVGIEVK